MSCDSAEPMLLELRQGEDKFFNFDFADVGGFTGPVLASPLPTVAQAAIEGSGSLTIAAPSVSGSKVQVKIAPGSATVPSRHRLTCTARGTDGGDHVVYGLLDVVAPPTEPGEDC